MSRGSTESASVACAGCGGAVDPLRAGHVAFLDGRFSYFCNADCKRAYFDNERPPAFDAMTAEPPAVAVVAVASAPRDIVIESATRLIDSAPPTPVTAPIVLPPASDQASGQATIPASKPAVAPMAHAHVELEAADEPPPSTLRSANLRLRRPSHAPPQREPTPLVQKMAEATKVTIVDPPPSQKPRRLSVRSNAKGLVVAPNWLRALCAFAIAAGALGPTLTLLGSGALRLRLPFVFVGALASAIPPALRRRGSGETHPLVAVLPMFVACVLGWLAESRANAHAASLVFFAGASVVANGVSELIVLRLKGALEPFYERLRGSLGNTARVLRGADRITLDAYEVRTGEEVLVEAGEIIPVDGVILSGQARVLPWFCAKQSADKKPGDGVVAGAKILSGNLRITAARVGADRIFARPALSHDVEGALPRLTRISLERGAPVASFLVALAAFASNAGSIEILAAGCAAALAFAGRTISTAVEHHHAKTITIALEHGVTYRDANAHDLAAKADIGVYCAKGTLLLGEPEICAIESLSGIDPSSLLALAAATDSVSQERSGLFAHALEMRHASPESIRHATFHPGLGVTATTHSGDRLTVGNHALMLREKISVAAADERISSLEAAGRMVIAIALGDRVVGLIALQDGLRHGARASVQRLLAVGIEPVLLSGQSREMCETVARSLGIDHVRPEVLPSEMAGEVTAMVEGGHVVAVIGHAPADEATLAAADVPIVLRGSGASRNEWTITLANDDVQSAAISLELAKRARERARTTVILGTVPGAIALAVLGFGLAPLALAPIFALGGAIAVYAHAREIHEHSGDVYASKRRMVMSSRL